LNIYKQLTDKDLKLEYITFGNGKETLICFHGFGQEAQGFSAFETTLGKQYTIHSVNLFYHGNSVFPDTRLENKPVEPNELKSIFEILRIKEEFISFSLAGYSLGGKVALTLSGLYPKQTKKLFLIAPDGIKANLWYHFASQTLIGQKLNKASIKNEWVFRSFMKLSSHLGFASNRQQRFTNSQMKSTEQRSKVYKIWMAHRKLSPDLKELITLINKNQIQVKVYVGKFDKIIPLLPIEKFINSISKGTLTYLNTGHEINLDLIGREIMISG
jgi:pimeloyl-ACP methyl ester carboxylesterase|tara:strand:- start:165 stop:980 length:816 start_codon:yes stop_codon:yes gene_type:complete